MDPTISATATQTAVDWTESAMLAGGPGGLNEYVCHGLIQLAALLALARQAVELGYDPVSTIGDNIYTLHLYEAV